MKAFLLILIFVLGRGGVQGKEPDEPAATPLLAAGHSVHGEVFNEGPRHAAVLMDGMGNAHFAVTTLNPLAQRFFD